MLNLAVHIVTTGLWSVYQYRLFGCTVTHYLPVPNRPRRKSAVCCSTEICCKSWRTVDHPSYGHLSARCLLGTRTASCRNKNTTAGPALTVQNWKQVAVTKLCHLWGYWELCSCPSIGQMSANVTQVLDITLSRNLVLSPDFYAWQVDMRPVCWTVSFGTANGQSHEYAMAVTRRTHATCTPVRLFAR